MSKNTLRTWAARRKQRGAALVEATVSIPFFILMYVAILFAHGGYIAKQQTIAMSRRDSWNYAMNYCEGSTPSGVSTSSTPPAPSAPTPPDASQSTAHAPSSSPNTTTESSNQAVAVAQQGATATAGQISFSATQKTSTWVACNEKPVTSFNLFKFAGKAFSDFVTAF